MQIAEILAREAIRYTAALYVKNIDTGEFDGHINVFHPDVEMVMANGKSVRGVQAIIDVTRLGAGKFKTFEGRSFQRHNLTTAMIEMTSETTAIAKHYVMVVTELGFDHFGCYTDTFVKHGDRWLIKKRHAVMEWVRPDSRYASVLQPAATE